MIKTLEQLRADLIGLIGELKAKDLDAEIAEKVKEFSDKLKSEIAEKTAAEIANAEINLKFVESKIAEQNAEITDEPEPESVKEE